MKVFPFVIGMLLFFEGSALSQTRLTAKEWVDSSFKTLSDEQKIGQLIIVRLSSIDPATRKVSFYEKDVEDAVKKYDIGGICLFQGGPITQARYINYFQSLARTPIIISIDAENGVGMRMDSVQGLPRQMTLGAAHDPELVYQYGRVVAAQCRRLGIQVDYAPVADINNNPDNPIINDRSFGEDKQAVTVNALQYMKALQDGGVMACAKHFPGHGDVSVDSHLDLPLISKSVKAMDTLELVPFKALFQAGVGSVMIAHLYIPAIDNTPNLATSLSYKNVTKLLKKKLKYDGLRFTDALEMKGVSKYFPNGEAAVLSLIAGNDMLCLPGNVDTVVMKIKEALADKRLKWKDINAHVKRVLMAKYEYGLANLSPVKLDNLTDDLNKDIADMRKRVSEAAITVLRRNEPELLPLYAEPAKRVAYIGIGLNAENEFARRMSRDYHAHEFFFDYSLDSGKAAALLQLMKGRYDAVIVGLHNYHRFPANQFGLSPASIWLLGQLHEQFKAITFVFGNPYAIKNFSQDRTLVACYEDDDITQDVAADLLNGKFNPHGRSPVTIDSNLKAGEGIVAGKGLLPIAPAMSEDFNLEKLSLIDSVCKAAIAKEAFPGCVVLVARDGNVVYDKAFGHLSYDNRELVYPETIYDLASVTKICATTMAVMKLYDKGKLDMGKTLGDYLPWVRGSNKEGLRIRDIMLHQAGLKAFIPFYKETIDSNKAGAPILSIYSWKSDSLHRVRVAENLYMRTDWLDTIYSRILSSPVDTAKKYVYSDNDFIFMGKIVESLSGMTLDAYVKKTFYDPLDMKTTGFLPRNRFQLNRIAPTENEQIFRKQLIRGDVHDPGSALFGGVAGHAGLFSDAYDLAVLEQLLLNGGEMNGIRFLKKETIDEFTDYQTAISRRGLGFDKPERNNASLKEPYPCISASPRTFGHTGFTGTCVWVDPKYNLVYVFLSNRVNPTSENSKISTLSVRGGIMELIYQAMGIH
jgi:beta-glucosidase-like glycosyl hydrolase/CubicO group peptidase (beta-lactamase class C family)